MRILPIKGTGMSTKSALVYTWIIYCLVRLEKTNIFDIGPDPIRPTTWQLDALKVLKNGKLHVNLGAQLQLNAWTDYHEIFLIYKIWCCRAYECITFTNFPLFRE